MRLTTLLLIVNRTRLIMSCLNHKVPPTERNRKTICRPAAPENPRQAKMCFSFVGNHLLEQDIRMPIRCGYTLLVGYIYSLKFKCDLTVIGRAVIPPASSSNNNPEIRQRTTYPGKHLTYSFTPTRKGVVKTIKVQPIRIAKVYRIIY